MFFRHAHVYLKVKDNHVWAKQLEGQTVIELHGDKPFSKPEDLIRNFDFALSVVRLAIRQVNLEKRRWVTPKVVIHPMCPDQEALTPDEKELFWKLVDSANTFDIRVWEGAELSDAQVIELFRA